MRLDFRVSLHHQIAIGPGQKRRANPTDIGPIRMADRHTKPDGDFGRVLLDAVESASSQLGALLEQVGEQQSHCLSTILAAAVSHEISNILTPVRGYAAAALADPSDQNLANRALRRAVEGTDRAIRAAEAMIESVHLSGRKDLQADVRSAAANAVHLLGPLIEPDSVTVKAEPCTAAMGQIALEQVLLNLLINAKAAAAPGKFRAIIKIRSTWNTPTPRIMIEVEDFGRGIPAERLRCILSESPQGNRKSGGGLGLLICRHLVETAGGSISARSQLGQGSCFAIDVPAASRIPAKVA